MKYFIILVILLTIKFYPQEDKNLYLLYTAGDERIKKGYRGINDQEWLLIELYYKNEKYETIALGERNPERRDTVQIRSLSKLNLKDIHWLTRTYLEYFNYFRGNDPKVDADGTLRVFDLNQLYKDVFVIIPDSSKGEAVITQVKHLLLFSID